MTYALGGLLLVLAVILVLADTSTLFMQRAALMMVADDAAIAAANAIDVEAIYSQGVSDTLVLDPALAQELAAQSVSGAQDERLADIRLDAVTVLGDSVEVLVSAAVPSAIGGIVGNRTMRIRARANSSTPTRF